MNNLNRLVLSLIFAIALSRLAHAHPGHGERTNPNSIQHYLLEPIHLVMLLAALCGLVFFLSFFRSALVQRLFVKKRG